MTKLVLFDLDGVLVNTKQIHFDALNESLAKNGYPEISPEEHTLEYDGLTTEQKLIKYNVAHHERNKIALRKQAITMLKMKTIKGSSELLELFNELKDKGYKVGVCSNAIGNTVNNCIDQLMIRPYLDVIKSNWDVDNPKPHPEIWWKAMSEMGVLPEETVIIEDSPTGLSSAFHSGARVIRVSSPDETNISLIDRIESEESYSKLKWKDDNLNVLIPMAGAGKRFAEAGYTFPKPLIDVNGQPMIQKVVENLGLEANYIFIVQKSHRKEYNLDSMLNLIAPNCTIVEVDGITEGAACTTLLAKEYIDNDKPLFIANSDQYVEWNPLDFMYKMNERKADGGIVTFKATHPKWSYAKTGDNGLVVEVAEKNPISNNATVGFYYWRHGSDYVKYASQMIEKDIRVNNEFYVCPVYNESIKDGKNIHTHEVKDMWGLGTPEDLERYLLSW